MADERVTHTHPDDLTASSRALPQSLSSENATELTRDYGYAVTELRAATGDLDSLSRILGQLGAIFYSLSHGKAKRVDELAQLGCYVADDWSNTADLMRERIQAVLDALPLAVAETAP